MSFTVLSPSATFPVVLAVEISLKHVHTKMGSTTAFHVSGVGPPTVVVPASTTTRNTHGGKNVVSTRDPVTTLPVANPVRKARLATTPVLHGHYTSKLHHRRPVTHVASTVVPTSAKSKMVKVEKDT